MYNKSPSEILHIDDDYTSFCLDEACALIRNKIDNGEKPKFRLNETVNNSYSSFSKLYEDVKKRG
jgi:hypothetical protein